ncbi:hypothetical protein PROFUN_08215 [Planoprotostelium fungivorum]|uniref:Uncharacterized protein n=1 Tax=Planoprotostelium fungivorum TaxID=1890364 RepID=A0A2P6N678_9EUKA|nr:hypothetical protein PROFUN_08215 [Planoprotostelium fungivorum]
MGVIPLPSRTTTTFYPLYSYKPGVCGLGGRKVDLYDGTLASAPGPSDSIQELYLFPNCGTPSYQGTVIQYAVACAAQTALPHDQCQAYNNNQSQPFQQFYKFTCGGSASYRAPNEAPSTVLAMLKSPGGAVVLWCYMMLKSPARTVLFWTVLVKTTRNFCWEERPQELVECRVYDAELELSWSYKPLCGDVHLTTGRVSRLVDSRHDASDVQCETSSWSR